MAGNDLSGALRDVCTGKFSALEYQPVRADRTLAVGGVDQLHCHAGATLLADSTLKIRVPKITRMAEVTPARYPPQLRAQALMVIRHTLNEKAPPRNAKIGKAMVDAAAQVAQRLARESAAAPVTMAH